MDEGKTIDRETKKKRNGTTKSKYITMTKKKRTRCIPHSYFTTYPLPIQLRDIRFRNSYTTILIGILFGCLCLPPQWLIFLFMCSFFLSFIFSRLYFCAPNHYKRLRGRRRPGKLFDINSQKKIAKKQTW